MARTPSGTTVAIATAFATALPFTAASNATEAVLTVAGATLASGDFVEVSSTWGRMNGRIFRLKAATATALTLEGFDTTNTAIFPTGLATGTVRKVTTWQPVSQVLGISYSGGEPKTVNFTYVEAEDEQTVFDGVSAITYKLDIDADSIGSEGYKAVKSISDASAITALRMTAKNGSMVLLSCTAYLNENPTIESGQVMKNAITFFGRGRTMRYTA